MPKKCTIGKCPNDLIARGMCGMHYQRWRKFGDPQKTLPRRGNDRPRPVVTERTCKECGHVGPPDQFVTRKNLCKPCSNAYKAQWLANNPDKAAAIKERGAAWRKRYELRRRAQRNGLDPDVIEKYYSDHDGRCEICGDKPDEGQRDLNMDHDHASGAFRGMLCDNCNSGLGRFKDDPERLKSAIQYLYRTQEYAR
jgi:hypothetical protein